MTDANTEWACLRMHFQEGANITQPRSGNAAHKLAAKAADAASADPRCRVPPEFFHHRIAADGRRIAGDGLSPFRYAGGKDSMTLTAVGGEAVDLLDTHGHRLVRCLSRFGGKPLRETWTRGQVELRPSRKLHHYRIAFAILTRKPLRHIAVKDDLLAGQMTQAVKDWTASTILDGLARQARMLGLPEPEADALLRVTSIGGACGYLHGENAAYYGSTVKDVRFSSDLDLRGPWSIGHVCLVGQGRIDRCREDDVAGEGRELPA